MNELSNLWAWATEAVNQRGIHTIALIAGVVALIIGAIWGLIKFFSSLRAGKNVTVHFGITPEQFLKGLNQREEEVRKQLTELKTSEVEQRRILERTLDSVYEQMTNLQIALEAKEAKLNEAYRVLEGFTGELGPEKMQQARQALEKGDTGVAENLFQEILAKAQTQAETGAAHGAEAAYQLGVLAESRIAYLQAQHYYQQAAQLQPDNPQYLNVAGKMAYTLGHYTEAEPLYQRSLAIREKALGPDHSDVAESLNNLALLYKVQGKYGDAEPLYQRALTIAEKVLGPEHPSVATSLNNLALLYKVQGKYGDAEPLYKRSLAIREKARGPEHPDVAISLNNLAELYRAQVKNDDAEPLYKRSQAIWEKALGPEHPNVATSLNNLAELYRAQGKYGEAEPLYQRSLTIDEKALGPEHPSVATSLNNLAALYEDQGKYGEAEPLYQRALTIFEKYLGAEHPDVATCLENYAILLKKLGREAEAEPLEARANTIRARHAEKNPQK